MRRKKNVISSILSGAALILSLTACTKQAPKYVIGVSQCSEDIWRDKLNDELQTGTYFHDGVELRFASADDSDEKQIEQIHVTDRKVIELYPRVGEQVIILGTPENFRGKLENLMTFYKNGLSKTGWNKYSVINLSFDGQIVCTKKNNTKNI